MADLATQRGGLVSEQAPERGAPRKKGGALGLFTEKIGPLPMWVWVLIIAGILIAWRLYSDKKNASSTTASASSDSVPADQVPEFINQTYTTVTAPAVQQPAGRPPRHPGPPRGRHHGGGPVDNGPQGAPQGGGSGSAPPPVQTTPPASAPTPTPQSNTAPPTKPGAPPMPTGVKAGKVTASSIAASWPKVAGATSYIVRVTYQDNLVKQITTTSPSATISGLGADHTYTIHVAAVGPGGASSETNGPGIKTSK